MERELTITPILLNHHSKPGPNSWVKLLMYEPDDHEKVATRGKMYAVLSLSSATQMDFTPLMELIIESLRQKYFAATNGGILQSLEVTLDAIHKQLILAGQQDKRLSAGFSFDILVAVNWGTVLYLGQLGESRACLVRDGKIFDINEGGQRTSGAFLSSGVVQAGDRFMLATNQLLAKFSRKQLLHHLSLGADTMAQSIEQQLDHAESSQESGIILQVDIKHVPSPEDESLQILNADTFEPVPRMSALTASLSNITSSTIGRSRQVASGAWHWKLFDKIPGLPVAIILLCILLLIASIYFKQSPVSSSKQVDISPVVAQLDDQLQQAQDLAQVNPDRAAEILQQMGHTLQQTAANHPDERLEQIADKRQRLQQQLLHIQILSPHPLKDIKEEPAESKLIKMGESIYVLTKANHLLRFVDGQITTLASGNRLDNAVATATTAGLAIANSQSIFSIDQNGNFGDTNNIAISSILAAASYQQNAYLLGNDGQLYKFIHNGQSFEGPIDYFPSPVNQSGLVDVAIDGFVYILRQDGSVEKYLGGQSQPLSLDRTTLISDPKAILTDEQLENLYILTDRALLTWSKEGQYIGQYQLPGEAVWQAALVDGTTKSIYILSDGKLVEAKLP
jgi:hypothetical protein